MRELRKNANDGGVSCDFGKGSILTVHDIIWSINNEIYKLSLKCPHLKTVVFISVDRHMYQSAL